MKRAAGYVRVSSRKQALEGESLETQQQQIEEYAKYKKWKLIKPLYSDPGISGGTIEKRPGIQKVLKDAVAGKFDALIVTRLSRLARNNRDIETIVIDNLQANNINFVSLSENFDLWTPSGRLMLDMIAAFSKFEAENSGLNSYENRLSRANDGKGAPTAGKLPVGRGYNKFTGEWRLGGTFDKKTGEFKPNKIADGYRFIAHKYINGQSLYDEEFVKEVERKFGFRHHPVGILRNLRIYMGDKWTVEFKGNKKNNIAPKSVTYTVPRILTEDEIQAVHDKAQQNRICNRRDVKKYPLNSFIRCAKCGYALSGGTIKKKKADYRYYRNARWNKCKCTSINADVAENIVFKMMFSDVYDEPAFNDSVKDTLPDENRHKELTEAIKSREQELRQINRDEKKLLKLYLNNEQPKNTVSEMLKEFNDRKSQLETELNHYQHRLKFLPDPETVKTELEEIRGWYKDFFGSIKHLDDMTFDDKQRFLNHFFNGKDEDGLNYGIYLDDKNGFKQIYFHGKYYGAGYNEELFEPEIMELMDQTLNVKSYLDDEKVKKFIKTRKQPKKQVVTTTCQNRLPFRCSEIALRKSLS